MSEKSHLNQINKIKKGKQAKQAKYKKTVLSTDENSLWSWIVVLCIGLLVVFYCLRPRDLERIFETFVVKNSHIELSEEELNIIKDIQKDGGEDLSPNFIPSSEDDQQVLREIYEKLSKVHPFAEQLSFQQGRKSYSVNKRQVFLCLKDENGEHYAMNMLMYVALHELAHCMCDEIGHTAKFHEIFEHLLEIAHLNDVYDKNIEPISSYCNYASTHWP